MGIVNVTPDSFSDGGRFIDPQRAIAHARQLIDEGADIVDIGGESTRPGATPVSVQEEIDRVIPVIEGLKDCGKLISIDTRHAATMRAALAAGAGMVNDVTALSGDSESINAILSSNALICLMHMKGAPVDMQNKPSYVNAVQEIADFLLRRIEFCETAGIDKSRIVADPGIGFGKALSHNLEILGNVAYLNKLGVPLLIGASRKRFIEDIFPGTETHQRLHGSLAVRIAGGLGEWSLARQWSGIATVLAIVTFAAALIRGAAASRRQIAG